MGLILVSFLSGVLTILAPCILPLLPIILWASVEDEGDKYRPYIIIASLGVSVILFSILLKASTVLIWVPASFWKLFSGGIIIIFGIITLFPNLWKSVSTKLGFSDGANKNLAKSSQKKGFLGSILIGFSLGPIFASCSPTYSLILAVILPVSFLFGFVNLLAYVVGLSVVLLAIALLGQKFTQKLRVLSDPNGKFKRGLGVLFLLVGLAILTGFDKKIEASILDSGVFDVTQVEQKILDNFEEKSGTLDKYTQ